MKLTTLITTAAALFVLTACGLPQEEDRFGTPGGSGPILDTSSEDRFLESFADAMDWMEQEHDSESLDRLYLLALHAYYEEEEGPDVIDGLRATQVLDVYPEVWEEALESRAQARERRKEIIRRHNEGLR
ncbi:hypothetical protein [Thioalkalivibrio sp. ALE16]|uniref:hypothetical protein n=1 Tax=Thioalkalivibrio sp. ALE16 TaxID=1158172 RepID=UPI0012DCFBA9|nr:hypothetical protein [Thioalkalivibrio sp. ALE16]